MTDRDRESAEADFNRRSGRLDLNRYSLPAYSFRTAEGRAVEAVKPDGEVVLWMLSRDHDSSRENYASDEPPAHERLGKLPREVRLALGFQCVHVNPRSGKRCRNVTDELDTLCGQHRPGGHYQHGRYGDG